MQFKVRMVLVMMGIPQWLRLVSIKNISFEDVMQNINHVRTIFSAACRFNATLSAKNQLILKITNQVHLNIACHVIVNSRYRLTHNNLKLIIVYDYIFTSFSLG
ncbi:hypothetical protein FND55_08820 [Lactobacillus paracasei subsp. paracasei]|nr:hypothetical protein DMC16_09110 [Lacticaseibacillus paracasei]MBG1273710.1 hypothetical protein [Lacticaseibacillus paracasei subsp. paracasei]AYG23697.1 hypothetical protein CFM84_11585 [Lacticaseibacillus paracasei]OSP83717.1 hypothetical protein B9J76_12010 [Lacticaseibacillus paracasei]RDV41661.1 hypothetical protein DQM07_07185 [Lacticaseibacillus paracasei subsp. paracasei]